MSSNGKIQKAGQGKTPRGKGKKLSPPIWDKIVQIVEALPPSEFHKLPTDLSANHDHYLYGSSLR